MSPMNFVNEPNYPIILEIINSPLCSFIDKEFDFDFEDIIMDIDHDTSNNDDNNNDIYLFYEVMIILVLVVFLVMDHFFDVGDNFDSHNNGDDPDELSEIDNNLKIKEKNYNSKLEYFDSIVNDDVEDDIKFFPNPLFHYNTERIRYTNSIEDPYHQRDAQYTHECVDAV
ncbi:hypothetical protein H8356DRAFT_1325908 [Neocallimastix lanati (nom. inval.)]|nr:hypothetical protein H8356DRAFT_1325908 [Neocallimastix sp. JGI-2020a]